MTINMYKMFYINDSKKILKKIFLDENSLFQRNSILKQLVESNEDYFNFELKRDRYKRQNTRKMSFMPENIEDKLKRIEGKEKTKKEKKIVDVDISRKVNFYSYSSQNLVIDPRMRKESIDIFENLKKNEKGEIQGEEDLVNDDENSQINKDEEYSFEKEDFGIVF